MFVQTFSVEGIAPWKWRIGWSAVAVFFSAMFTLFALHDDWPRGGLVFLVSAFVLGSAAAIVAEELRLRRRRACIVRISPEGELLVQTSRRTHRFDLRAARDVALERGYAGGGRYSSPGPPTIVRLVVTSAAGETTAIPLPGGRTYGDGPRLTDAEGDALLAAAGRFTTARWTTISTRDHLLRRDASGSSKA